MLNGDEITEWLDDMARVNGTQEWCDELQCWVWSETREPLDPQPPHMNDD